ncbi:MAG: MBL fold metallo-hydrolase [Synergistaceae bacterium]|nr:MBL fold metallo-hydrolase [Synergistaceae bacterium]
MTKLTMLGTGNALVSECFNTCFVISSKSGNLLVDTGGGNYLIHQLRHSGFDLQDIHNIFISHSHIDHILGVIWVIRLSAQLMNKNRFEGDVNIYSHNEVIELLYLLANKLLLPYQAAFIGPRIHLIAINHEETRNISGYELKFFDIGSTRTKQFGFVLSYDDSRKLTFCGDEPCSPQCEKYAVDSEWLLHEAFCLYSQADIFNPYEKHHSTVKDACELAQRLRVKNLLLYHTEEKNLSHRKELYTQEGSRYFTGNIFIPDDLETLDISSIV